MVKLPLKEQPTSRIEYTPLTEKEWQKRARSILKATGEYIKIVELAERWAERGESKLVFKEDDYRLTYSIINTNQ